MKNSPSFTMTDFTKTFNKIATHKHRYSVFTDFVTMSAISLHNAVYKKESLESEYLEIVAQYAKTDIDHFCKLLGILIELLEPEPRDILGVLCMELELGNDLNGQYFTPPDISKMMAKISSVDLIEKLGTSEQPFITLSEPACGAGGMVLAFVNEIIESGYDPAKKLWVQCIDIDRTAALMCYVQLSLWNVPAEIIVGNTLSLEFREFFYTPAYYMNNWQMKLEHKQYQAALKSTLALEEESEPTDIKTEIKTEKNNAQLLTKTQRLIAVKMFGIQLSDAKKETQSDKQDTLFDL